ncbi:MAG: TolC family protein [Thermoanaerobaculia bacterium]|nr:TolC family protein [Thermoanaerobaculia bacterium]
MKFGIGYSRQFAVSLLLLVVLVAIPGESQEPDSADLGIGELTRPALVALVLERNPSLETARSAADAASERATIESALDDPRVMARVAPLSVGSDEGFGTMVEVEQMLPWKGRRSVRANLARAEAEIRELDLEELRVELAAMASTLWADLWLAERQLETNGHHVDLLADLRGAADAQYVVGQATQQDLIQAEVEIARMRESRVRLDAARRDAIARINALLHRAPRAPLPPLPAATDATGDVGGPSDALQAVAVADRPALVAADASIRAASASAELASLARKPDIGLAAIYDSMEGRDHQFQVGVSVNLPIWRGRLAAAEREAQHAIEAAESRRVELEDQVRLEVDLAHRAVETAGEIGEIYRDHLVPAATDQFAAARAGFETGRDPFLSVLIAENNLRDVTLGGYEATAELIRGLAMLDRAIGRLPETGERN